MADIQALMDYFRKLQRAVDSPDFAFFNFRILKKNKIDDLLVCTLALLPDSFKKAMKKRLQVDMYPSVSCYTRLSKLLKKPFFLSSEHYIVRYGEVTTMIQGIKHNLERDIKRLEED